MNSEPPAIVPTVDDPEALHAFALIQRAALLGSIADLRTCAADLASSRARIDADVVAYTAYQARVKLEIASSKARGDKYKASHIASSAQVEILMRDLATANEEVSTLRDAAASAPIVPVHQARGEPIPSGANNFDNSKALAGLADITIFPLGEQASTTEIPSKLPDVSKIKLAKYSGVDMALRPWVFSISMTLANNNVFNPFQQCGLAIEALEDRALDWASTKKWSGVKFNEFLDMLEKRFAPKHSELSVIVSLLDTIKMASSANIDDHLDNFTEALKGISIAPAYELALFVFTLIPSYRKVVFEDSNITDLNGAVSAGRSMQVAKGASSAHHHHASANAFTGKPSFKTHKTSHQPPADTSVSRSSSSGGLDPKARPNPIGPDGRVTQAERQYRIDNKLCKICGSGHDFNVCPLKQ